MMDAFPFYAVVVPTGNPGPGTLPWGVFYKLRGAPQRCLRAALKLRDGIPLDNRRHARIVPGQSLQDFPQGPINGLIVERDAVDLASPLWTT